MGRLAWGIEWTGRGWRFLMVFCKVDDEIGIVAEKGGDLMWLVDRL